MGTEKRERQKANRAAREHEIAREAARSRTLRIGLLIGGAIVAVFLLVFAVGQFTGDDEDSIATSQQDDAPSDGTIGDGDDPSSDGVTPPEPATTEAIADGDDETGVDGPAATEPASTVDCPPADGADEQIQSFDGPPPFCLDPEASYSALVSTTVGDITIELDQEAAPTTVNNFVFLARYNYFDDTVCHRVIQDFVAQCGDPTATGTGGPGYQFDDELPDAGQYEIGSIAMANSGPNTNGSQFFIISGPDGAALPPQYNLFGQVGERDLAVVEEMNARGSLDRSGVATEEIRILDVVITEG